MSLRFEVFSPDGIGEVRDGDDLAGLVAPYVESGDVVVITSKVVSKAEGRVRSGEREEAIRAETVRLVARRGPTSIVENHLGLVMAAAGVDASNVAAGRVVLLPLDPDATARRIRDEVVARTGHNVAVLISDTAGRAWRHGQTDLAIGAAGIEPLEVFDGQVDRYGNPLAVTAPAVIDELAGLAEIASGKLGGRPLTVVRGLAERVLAPGRHGPGARSLVREPGTDMFGLGSREAVVSALAGTDRVAFGLPATADEFGEAARACGFEVSPGDVETGLRVLAPADDPRLSALLHAHAWGVVPDRSADSATQVAPLS